MIDINELRKLAQAATQGEWYIGSGTYEGRNIYSAKAVTDDEGYTYNPVVATAEDDGFVCWYANARLIAAANPAAITELLDDLKAAELERDTLRAKIAERDELMAALQRIADGQEMSGVFTFADVVLRYQEIARTAIARATGEQT